MDLIQRASAQITDIETEVYQGLDLDRLRSHKGTEITFFTGSNVSIENLILVQSAGKTNSDVNLQAN
jgi:hypothetical protein